MTDLDTRMQAAAESLRRSVDAVPVPAARRRGRAQLVVTVVAVVVVAGAAMLLLRTGDRSADVATGSTRMPRLIADPVPQGMNPSYAADLPLSDDEILPGSLSVTVYGDAAADDPFAIADLGILVVTDETLAVGGDPVTVRGRPGEATDNGPYGRLVTWDEAPGSEVTVASRTLEGSQLLAIAEGLSIEGTSVALGPLPAGLPVALSEVGTATAMLFEGPLPVPRTAAGHVVEYRAKNGESGLAVASAGAASSLAVLRWSLNANQVVEVRGGQGWVGRFPSEPGFRPIAAVVWEESPGVIALVAGDGITEDDLLAVAENLRPATDDEWAALLGQPHDSGSGGDDPSSATTVTGPDGEASRNQTAMTTPPGSVVSLHGIGDGNRPPWVVYINNQGGLCAEASDGPSGWGTCGDAQQRTATLHDDAGNAIVVFGVMPNGAVSVDVEGDIEAALQTTTSPDGSTSIYALALDGRPVPAAVTFRDGQGQVIEVAAVAA